MDELVALLAAILQAGSQVLDADCRLTEQEAVARARAILSAAQEAQE